MRDSGDIVRVRDGHMMFVGRSDSQVKRFGHQINLDYVEKSICKYADVTSCALVLNQLLSGVTLLHLFVVPKLAKETNTNDLERYKAAMRKQLEDALPRQARPDQVHFVWQFPMTRHGKIDKRNLLDDVLHRDVHFLDKVSVTRALSEMWRDSTGQNINDFYMDEGSRLRKSEESLKKTFCSQKTPQVKPSDMFMLVGGDSFRAVQLSDKINRWIHQRCYHTHDLSTLFEIITSKPFSSLVSFVEDVRLCCNTEVSHSSKSAETPNTTKVTSADSEPIAKISKVSDGGTNLGDREPFFSKLFEARNNETCSCYAKRGSERFACPLCENNPGSSIFPQSTPIISPTKNFSLKWSVCLEKCIDASPLVVPSAIAREGVVFIGSHSCLFVAVSLTNGAVLWSTRLGGRIESSACLSRCGKLVVVGKMCT